MASLADVVQQMGPSITYDERTKRFHDMEQNYRMVSTRGVTAGRPTRADGRGSSAYVTQEIFNAFRSEVYLYISKVASFTREALIEMQKSMIGEQRDTETLRNDQRREAEERRERRKELISGALTKVSSGIRQATGMGPLGALFTGISAGLVALLANVDLEKLRETFNSISSVFDKVKEFFDKLKEYSDILIAIGAALAAMVAANMLDRLPRGPRGSGRGGGPPTQRSPAPTGSGSGPKPPTGGTGAGGGAAGTSGMGAGPRAGATGTPSTEPPKPQIKPGFKEVETSGGKRYRSEKTGRFVKPSEALTTPGEPTKQPKPGQPTQDRPRGNRMAGLGRFLGVLGPLIEIFTARSRLETLSEQRDKEEIDENAYKDEVIRILAGSAGALIGGGAGGLLGAIAGPVGSALGAYVGALGGEKLGEFLATTDIGRRLGEVVYDRFFAERSTGQPEAALMDRLTQLQRERRERTTNIDEMTRLTDAAVNQGRITESQARQLEEIGAQEGTNLRVGDIELAIEQIQALRSEGEGAALQPTRERGTGRLIVLPTIYQEVVTQNQNQSAPASTAEGSSEIQTRIPDPTFGAAAEAAAFQRAPIRRGGLVDRARARNAR